MDTLIFASPYLVPDRDAWDDLATQWTRIMLGADTDGTDPHMRLMAGIIADSPIPIPPAWTVGDSPVTVSYLTCPHLWLPAEWAPLRCGETRQSWHMRMLATCDLLGWIRRGSAEQPPAMLPISDNEDPASLAEVVSHLTQGDPSLLATQLRDTARARVDDVFPDGYPVDDMIALGHAIARDAAAASTVMSAHTAVAYARTGDPDCTDTAVRIIRRLRERDGDLFDITHPDPESTAAWVRAHTHDALPLFELLETARLEPHGVRDMVAGMLADV